MGSTSQATSASPSSRHPRAQTRQATAGDPGLHSCHKGHNPLPRLCLLKPLRPSSLLPQTRGLRSPQAARTYPTAPPQQVDGDLLFRRVPTTLRPLIPLVLSPISLRFLMTRPCVFQIISTTNPCSTGATTRSSDAGEQSTTPRCNPASPTSPSSSPHPSTHHGMIRSTPSAVARRERTSFRSPAMSRPRILGSGEDAPPVHDKPPQPSDPASRVRIRFRRNVTFYNVLFCLRNGFCHQSRSSPAGQHARSGPRGPWFETPPPQRAQRVFLFVCLADKRDPLVSE